jgi:hypothetical protein
MINRCGPGLAVLFCLLLALPALDFAAPAAATECLACHSDVGRLLQLTQELAKSKPATVSTESEGEG